MEPIDPFYSGGLKLASASYFAERLESLRTALINKSPGAIVDEAKALLECTFRTVITDNNGKVSSVKGREPTIPQLYTQAKNCIQFSLDYNAARHIDEACEKISVTSAQIRNNNGAVSHGKDGHSINLLGLHEANFIAREALSVAAFFINKRSESAIHEHTRLHYEDHTEFNDYLDDLEPWPKIFGSETRPSEILFYTDRIKYQETLIEYHERNLLEEN